MTIKLIEATETHADLSGILMKLFLKNPALPSWKNRIAISVDLTMKIA